MKEEENYKKGEILGKQSVRSSTKVMVPKPNLTRNQKFYLYLAPTIFNSIPRYIKTLTSKSFLKQLTVVLAKIYEYRHHPIENVLNLFVTSLIMIDINLFNVHYCHIAILLLIILL